MRLLSSVFLICLVLSCCRTHGRLVGVQNRPAFTKDVLIDKSYTPPTEFDFTIDSLQLLPGSDVLNVYVTYSGGCKEHSFDLVTTGALMKSMPPQMRLYLKHERNGDACREQKTDTLGFNLKPLQQASTKTIVLRMGDKSATYKY